MVCFGKGICLDASDMHHQPTTTIPTVLSNLKVQFDTTVLQRTAASGGVAPALLNVTLESLKVFSASVWLEGNTNLTGQNLQTYRTKGGGVC